MSFANTAVGNGFRPDRRILDSIAALTAQIAALKARADTLPVHRHFDGEPGRGRALRDARRRPSFEVDSGQIEITYHIGARPETLTRVIANASEGVFLSVYNGTTLLGGGLANGVLQLNFALVAPRIVATLGGTGSHMGDIVLTWE